jgi:hypothetical protein
MKTRLCAAIVAGALAFPALAGYGKDDTQIMFAFGGGGNNARLYAEVLAQAERDRKGQPVTALADRLAGHSAGAMLATFLTLPQGSGRRPMTASETLEHFGTHAPNLLGTLKRGSFQPVKAKVQAELRQHMAAALGSGANVKVSALPRQTQVLLAEVFRNDVEPASFSAAEAADGLVPDVTVAELLTAAVSVEKLAGQVPLPGAGEDSKSARIFMDHGSRDPGVNDPTPVLIRAAVQSGKPAHIFAFEGGFGFDAETERWAEGTRRAEQRSAQGLSLGDLDPRFARVRVHLFHSTRSEFQACANCRNADGKYQTACPDHAPNLTGLIGQSVPLAQATKMIAGIFDPGMMAMPTLTLALNLQAGLASAEMNAQLTRIANAQMIGAEGARTPSYARLLAVLAEADAANAKAGATSAPASAAESKEASVAAASDAAPGKGDAKASTNEADLPD